MNIHIVLISDSTKVMTKNDGQRQMTTRLVSRLLYTSLTMPVSCSCISFKYHYPAITKVYSVLEKSLKMLEFGIKTSRPLKVLENR